MDTKKENILEAAAALFLERGFQRTSTQEIAESCTVSKATLYKYFSSKEELGLQVVFYLTEQLLFQIEQFRQRTDLTPRERLKESILYRMNRFGERTRFVDVLLFSFTPEQRNEFFPAVNRTKFQIFYNFSHLLREAFELESEVAAWELSLNLNGLIRELTFIEMRQEDSVDVQLAAEFIIDSLQAIAEQRASKPPVLTEKQIERLTKYFTEGICSNKVLPQRGSLLNELKSKAKALPVSEQSDALEALELLDLEYRKKTPKHVMIEALISYLETKVSLAQTAALLRKTE